MSERVLVFAAHPDDDGIGCGGSIVKHLRAGREVFIVYGGDTGGIDCSFLQPEEYAKRQREETYAAARVLGVPRHNLFLLEEQPWKYSEERLRLQFLEIIRQVKPRICYIPHSRDAHVDHQTVSNAAFHAINMAPSPWFRKFGDDRVVPDVEIVLAYEVWTMLEAPNYFEPLTVNEVLVNEAALMERKTQEVDKYIPAYHGRVTMRAKMKEGEVCDFAEAFQIVKALKLF